MNRNLPYIIVVVLTIFISSLSYAAQTNEERLSLLQPLIQYDLSFDTNVTVDSVVLWEKMLSPELEEQRKYDMLFLLKGMAVQSLITEGKISLAVNNANAMYQKAKEINYPLGTALALRAIGNTYLGSSAIQAAVKSYEESLYIMKEIPEAEVYLRNTLSSLILIKISTLQTADFEKEIEELETYCEKYPNSPCYFYLPCCRAFYDIQTNQLPQALIKLQQLEQIYAQNPYPYFLMIVKYLYGCYYIASKEYPLALKIYDELMLTLRNTCSYRNAQIAQEHARILALMGKYEESCKAYEDINTRKDSLNTKNYLRQINELHTLYQIDKNELNNLNRQKKIIHWSWCIILVALSLIVFFIFRIKRNNRHLLQSQQEQEKIKQQVERSIRTKSLFLSNMSHEIRTPLNALSGFSAILTEESIDEEIRNQCNDIIQQNSELLLKLINDVIDLSSLEVGKMTFKFKEYDAVGICRNVIDMVEKIKQTNADVQFITSLDSLELTTDNTRLQQVLINLLINATKFTSQGSIILELKLQDNNTALFSVTDTGTGIPQEKQKQIFSRFEKLNESAQGTGLGLSICQLIIKEMGGKIWTDPAYTEGARFFFTHPIRQQNIQKEEVIE